MQGDLLSFSLDGVAPRFSAVMYKLRNENVVLHQLDATASSQGFYSPLNCDV